LFDAVTGKPVSTARLVIEIDLPSNTFVERQKTFIFRTRKIHHATLAAEREAYLMGSFLLSQCRESQINDAAIQFVPCPNIPYRAAHISYDRAVLVAGPLQTLCRHTLGIRFLLFFV
jgi:hypothetical protein